MERREKRDKGLLRRKVRMAVEELLLTGMGVARRLGISKPNAYLLI